MCFMKSIDEVYGFLYSVSSVNDALECCNFESKYESCKDDDRLCSNCVNYYVCDLCD